MIFATVGSHPSFRFDRFLRALESLEVDDLVVQHGPGEPPSNAAVAVAWMSFADYLDHVYQAEKVISHAGIGTILNATRAGQTPVVVPRLRRFKETVDDHQLDLARSLDATGRVVVVEDLDELAARVAGAPPRSDTRPTADSRLAEAVRLELLARPA
ncbi:MAG TPA: glycosyltransferase [Solirubrobacterales bacterium]